MRRSLGCVGSSVFLFAVKGDDLRSLGTAAGALHLAAPEGREEGLAACRCMCAILFLLLSKGLVLLKEHCVNVEDPPRQTPKPLSAPASNGIPGVGTHIRLRGLPWDVNEDAIIRFVKPVVEIRESDVCVCVGLNVRAFTFSQHSSFKHSQAVLSIV